MPDPEHRPDESASALDLPEDKETPFTPVDETEAAKAVKIHLDELELGQVPECLFLAEVNLAFAAEQEKGFLEEQCSRLN